MLLSLTSCLFFSMTGNCISSLGSHIFLSHLGRIQPFLTLSQLNHISSPSFILWVNHSSSFSGFCGCNLVSILSRINSATFLAHHFHHSTFLWTSQSSFSSPASNAFLIFSIHILYNPSPVESVSSCSASVVPCHCFKQMCRWFFHTSPPQLGSAFQKHLRRGFGAQRPAWYRVLPPVGGIHLPCFTLHLNSDCLREGLLFASAHWETEKRQPGMHPKPTHFGFWCHLKAARSPHWCSTVPAVVWGDGPFQTHGSDVGSLRFNLQSARSWRQHAGKKLFPLFLHTPLKVTAFSESQLTQTCWKRFSLDLYYGLEKHKRPFSVQSIVLNY